jgi:glucokinase
MLALAADIGGTYSRLAWFDDGGPASKDAQVFENACFDSLEAVIEEGMAALGAEGEAIDRMVLAVPGPVHRDPVTLTNIQWQVQREALRTRFKTARLMIVNDFQAAALGAVNEPREHLKVLNPEVPDNGPLVVTGAGTGLGMAWLPQRDHSGLPRATEGGHLDFAPTDAVQLELYRALVQRYGHVSYERVVSGDGLVDSFRFFAGAEAGADSPAQIVTLAAQGERHAIQAVQLFVKVFAAYAGNLALAFNPTGGIYLCGGLSVHLADWFDPTLFMAAFAAKGRMADVARRIPVFLVTRHDAGLRGAKHIIRKDYRADSDDQQQRTASPV